MTLEHEHVTYLTQGRQDFILGRLAKRMATDNWVRISTQELIDFGGNRFFAGCKVDFLNDGQWFTTSEAHGWTEPKKRVRLDVRITVPWRESWTPGDGFYKTYCTSNTNEGKTQMEHHVDRLKLIETVKGNQTVYSALLERVRELYRAEIEKKTEEHVQGKIAQNEIKVVDKDGTILLPQDSGQSFADQLVTLEMDTRKVVVLDDEEFDSYVHARWSGLEALVKLQTRMERL